MPLVTAYVEGLIQGAFIGASIAAFLYFTVSAIKLQRQQHREYGPPVHDWASSPLPQSNLPLPFSTKASKGIAAAKVYQQERTS